MPALAVKIRLEYLNSCLFALQNIPSNAFLENNVIQMLDIGHNRFRTLHPNSFANLKQLQFLYVSNNSLLNV